MPEGMNGLALPVAVGARVTADKISRAGLKSRAELPFIPWRRLSPSAVGGPRHSEFGVPGSLMMDASTIAAMATQNSQLQLAIQKDVAVQKKAMESQEMAAQALLQTIPDIGEMQSAPRALPDNVGTNINTKA